MYVPCLDYHISCMTFFPIGVIFTSCNDSEQGLCWYGFERFDKAHQFQRRLCFFEWMPAQTKENGHPRHQGFCFISEAGVDSNASFQSPVYLVQKKQLHLVSQNFVLDQTRKTLVVCYCFSSLSQKKILAHQGELFFLDQIYRTLYY